MQRFNAEEGLYELALPNGGRGVADWGDLTEGMLVEAQVTGHNTGGLECEVNHIRGFIPISQIALYRVEDLAEFVGQRFTCLVTEANPRAPQPGAQPPGRAGAREGRGPAAAAGHARSRARSTKAWSARSWTSARSSTSAAWTACCTSASWAGPA